jgi:hypothetical protein
MLEPKPSEERLDCNGALRRAGFTIGYVISIISPLTHRHDSREAIALEAVFNTLTKK